MHQRVLTTPCFLAALLLSCAIAFEAVAAAVEPMTFTVETSDTLKKQGVTASSAATPAQMDPVLPEITVQMNFTAPISELICLCALNEKGEVLYYSKTLRMTAKKAGTHPVSFAFPEGTVLNHVSRVVVIGPADMKDQPKKEGILGEAKEIIEELFE
jgi:hypothetical protein